MIVLNKTRQWRRTNSAGWGTLLLLFMTASSMAAEMGSLVGQFAWMEERPAPRVLNASKDFHTTVADETLQIGKNGGVANVVIRAVSAELASTEDVRATSPILSAQDGRFVPHVLVMNAEQQLTIRNKTPFGASFRIGSFVNTVLPANRRDQFEIGPGIHRVASAIHPWMSAHLVVLNTQFVGLSDSDGRFQISDLPVGKWEFRIWHEQGLSLRKAQWLKNRLVIDIAAGRNDLGRVRLVRERGEARRSAGKSPTFRNTRVTSDDLRGLSNVQKLSFVNCKMASDALLQFEGKATLATLELTNWTCDDSTFEATAQFGNLRTLRIKKTDITVGGLKAIGRLASLHVLDISSCKINNEGLKHLESLKTLQILRIADSQIIDGTLAILLPSLPSLKWLDVGSSPITDAGLVPLQDLRDLRTLVLSGTKITDQGLAHIGGLSKLHDLHLTQTEVTDDGLQHLEGLGHLRVLSLGGTSATRAGKARLRKSLPNLNIQ